MPCDNGRVRVEAVGSRDRRSADQTSMLNRTLVQPRIGLRDKLRHFFRQLTSLTLLVNRERFRCAAINT